MNKLILASLSGVAFLGLAACSDSGTDGTQTQSVNPPVTEPATPPAAAPTEPGTDGTGTMQPQPAPAEPAPAQ